MQDKIEIIKNKVLGALSCSAHDLSHVIRVYNTAMYLAEGETIDTEVLQAAVWLHDIARVEEVKDKTGNTDHAILGAKMARPILEEVNFDEYKIIHIQDCIRSHRYRSNNKPQSLEAKILFDADKLDSIGAIGIVRAYMFAGQHKMPVYADVDLTEYAKDNLTKNGRIKDVSKHNPYIEFEIKLKHVKDRLYTKRGRELGEERTSFFNTFFDRLQEEIEGKK